jgi:hypothetical protein
MSAAKPDRRPLMDPAETSAYLNVPENTLRWWRSRGEGPPYVKAGRLVRYDPRAVDRWVDSQTVGAA